MDVPIVLTRDLDPKVIFWAGIAPPLLIFSFSKFLLRPLRRQYKLSKVHELCTIHGYYISAVCDAYSNAMHAGYRSKQGTNAVLVSCAGLCAASVTVKRSAGTYVIQLMTQSEFKGSYRLLLR